MESMNPGGTGKDRAARSMILEAESRGELPPPLKQGSRRVVTNGQENDTQISSQSEVMISASPTSSHNNNGSSNNIPDNIHNAIITALHTTKTTGILIEGTSGSTGISLASLSCSRGHGVIVVMPDDQSSQKVEYLQRLGAGVVVVQNCSISNPQHYVNVAKRIWEWLQVERRYDDYYWDNVFNNANSGDEKRSQSSVMDDGRQTIQPTNKRLLQAAFMNQFENLANVKSHYTTTGPEIYNQLNGNIDAFVMSAGTGGTLVGVGAYLKEQVSKKQTQNVKHRESKQPRIVLADPPGSSLYNKIKFGVAYTSQQSEQRLRRHRYDTLAEGIGLDRITANFGLGCEEYDSASSFGERVDMLRNDNSSSDTTPVSTHTSLQPTTPYRHSKIIDDALSITDQQAIYMAHYLLRHEGLFVGSSTAMNIVAALMVAIQMSTECEIDNNNDDDNRDVNVVTVVCDGGHRHTSRFWNKKFVVEDWGLAWPGDIDDSNNIDNHDRVNQKHDGKNILELLGIDC